MSIIQTVLRKNRTVLNLSKKGIVSLKNKGVRYTFNVAIDKLKKYETYKMWMKRHRFSESELEQQRTRIFDRDITFSIVVPLYNTPARFLREMIESVQAQTYGKWELCMADGSDDNHSEVEKICLEYSKRDGRIKYKKLEKNLGISVNTNACIQMSTGNYIALLDHDDILSPAALHEMMIAICEKNADFIYTDEAIFISPKPSDISYIHFKPDYAPDTLRSNNYICHFTAFKRELLSETGGFRKEYDGSQDHDLILRLTRVAHSVVHIPEVLYYWRAHPASVALSLNAKDYAPDAGRRAVLASVLSLGYLAEVCSSEEFSTIYHVKYHLKSRPRVSIIIPNCDHCDDLRTCLDSIRSKTTYDNYEIIVIENNSKKKETFDYYELQTKQFDDIKIVTWNGDGSFNYSKINNYGIKAAATGDYYLLLNNDTKVISPNWIEEMLMYAQRDDVGAVGAKLYYPDGTIQHAGVIVGLCGVAGHVFRGIPGDDTRYMNMFYVQNMSAVTAACMMIRKDVWDSVGGLDDSFAVDFNDVDLCMRIRQKGYLIVWTPYAELYHCESKSRGVADTSEKKARFNSEVARFKTRWAKELEDGDPYYNRNLSLNYSLSLFIKTGALFPYQN